MHVIANVQHNTISYLFGILCLLFFSCANDLENELLSIELDSDTPELIIYEGVIRQVAEQLRIITVEEAAFFTSDNRQEIKKASIEEYKDEQVSLRAQADEVSINSETNDARISGNISLRVEEEGITIFGDSFSWTDAGNKLESLSDAEVRIVKDDGSTITGRRIIIDGNSQSVVFEKGASGVLVTEDE